MTAEERVKSVWPDAYCNHIRCANKKWRRKEALVYMQWRLRGADEHQRATRYASRSMV